MSEIYRKVRVLGSGSAATVHEGWDEHLGRAVAIKELLPACAADRELAGQFLAGARRMAEISHPHVLAVYQVDQSHGTPWLILELADGGTLQDAARAGPVSPERAAGVLRQMLLALGELHRHGIVHNHIQPDNVFLCRSAWKLGGLGLTPVLQNPSLATFASKMSKYRSPEEVSQVSDPTPGSDLYSLGLMIYELLVGEARLREEVEKRVRQSPEAEGRLWLDYHLGPAELPLASALVPRVPKWLAATLQRMMNKDPAARYTSASEVLGDLERSKSRSEAEMAPGPEYGRTMLVAGTPGAAADRGDRRKRQKRRIAALALGVLLVVIVGVALLLPRKPAEVATSAGETPPTPAAEPSPLDTAAPAELAAALERLATTGSGAGDGLEIAAIRDGVPAALVPVGASFGFRLRADRPVYGALFVLSPDGAIYCLYPNPSRPSALAVPTEGALDVPRSEERAEGFDLVAGEPAGRHVAYLLAAAEPLPALPGGETLNPWIFLYPLRSGPRNPAAGFVRWVEEQRRARPETTGLATLAFDVTP